MPEQPSSIEKIKKTSIDPEDISTLRSRLNIKEAEGFHGQASTLLTDYFELLNAMKSGNEDLTDRIYGDVKTTKIALEDVIYSSYRNIFTQVKHIRTPQEIKENQKRQNENLAKLTKYLKSMSGILGEVDNAFMGTTASINLSDTFNIQTYQDRKNTPVTSKFENISELGE